ncbi:alanine--glyoxylate aminotransferase family protein [soil metagenome]
MTTHPSATEFARFFLPGPTAVRPEVLQALARQPIGHRSAAATALLAGVEAPLREVFGTERPVYVATCSATGLMEAGVRCGVRRRALCLVNGAVSERFRDLVTACGRHAAEYAVPWGEAHDADEVERRLLADPGCDALTVVHSETSTGVLNPLREIAAAVRSVEERTGREILLLVDGVTSVGGARVRTDEWRLDWLLTGSQKALALPPGLAFGAASRRLLERAETLPERGSYFDLLEWDRYAANHQTPTTPAVNLLYALEEQLRYIAAEGIGARTARHTAMAARCAEWVEETGARWGLGVLAPPERRSPTVTALTVSGEGAAPTLVRALAERGYTVGSGYGRLKGETFRIGHMGDHTVEELDDLLDALTEVLGA